MSRLVSRETEASLRRLVGLEVYPSLQLAGISQEQIDPLVYSSFETQARALYVGWWNEKLKAQHFGSLPLSEDFVFDAIYETMVATAAALSHKKKGAIGIDQPIAAEAVERVLMFVSERGIPPLIWAYAAVVVSEDGLAIRHYAREDGITEQDFVQGRLHRPWARRSLVPNLFVGLAAQTLRIEPRDGIRRVFLTPQGEGLLQDLLALLKSSGYWERRRSFMHLSHFDMYTDWEAVSRSVWPDLDVQRRAFLEFAGIRPGMQVLEVACGPGNLTLDAGLAGLVGDRGTVVATDFSASMIERLRERVLRSGAKQVKAIQADVQDLPFAPDSFDAAVGSIFIHFTDKDRALRELIRVVRPGGAAAVLTMLRRSEMPPLFLRWFEPMFRLMRERGISPRESFMPEPGEIAERMQKVGFTDVVTDKRTSYTVLERPADVVRHFIQGVNYFQEALEELPWGARQKLVQELTTRGSELTEALPLAERNVPYTLEFVRGRAPGAAPE